MGVKATNQITIVDVTDAYSVMLTSEAYTFVGGTNGVGSGQSCSTEVVAFCGSNQCTSVEVTADKIICPNGINATISGSGTPKVTIKFTTNATISDACEASIPVDVDGITVNKKFSFAVAKAGANGTSVSISSSSIKYQVGDSGTVKPTDDNGWKSDVPSVPDGKYLWTQTIVNYSDGKSTESYTVSYKAANGASGSSVSISKTLVEYLVGGSGTNPPSGNWSPSVPLVDDGKYLWTRTTVQYSDGNKTVSYSVSYNAIDGADAITLTITSSAGTIFKNNNGSTTLTAHVFKAGTELTIASNGTVSGGLGTIKWYKTGSTTSIKTANAIEVKASEVLNTQSYTCQLE